MLGYRKSTTLQTRKLKGYDVHHVRVKANYYKLLFRAKEKSLKHRFKKRLYN